MTTVSLPHDFTPRSYQLPYMSFFDRNDPHGGLRAFWVMHRRAGKDLTALHQTAKQMHERVGVYWHVFPTGEQARKAIWEGFRSDGKRIMENVFPKAIRKSPREWLPQAEMIVELHNGSIWRLIGSDKIEVVGAGPVGVTFSEYALSKPTAWNLIRPMMRENGGWASFITTPRGRNHAWEGWQVAQREAAKPGGDKRWFAQLRTIEDTKALPLSVIDEERAEGMPEPLIRQEYYCDWNAALVGSVWGEELSKLDAEGRTAEWTPDRDEVFVSFDLGVSDSTAMWFWRAKDDGVEFIDYYEANGKGIEHYCKEIDSRGYKWLKLWLPHDAKARSLQTGVSIFDQLMRRYGSGKVAIVPRLSLMDGIQAGRWLLQQPGTRFHPGCGEGLEALRQYHYEYDEDRKTYSGKPEHDWTSHAADAFRYAAIVAKLAGVFRPKKKVASEPALKVERVALTLDQLYADRPRRSARI